MIRTSPFHERTSALNEMHAWEHWASHLAATRYQASEKFEYFAVRNAAGLFDTSPLYKYRIAGADAEAFLAGVLARDIRACAPGQAQYTLWCDDRGFVVEDGVILRHARDEFLLTTAEPNLAWFQDLVGRERVTIEDVSDAWAALAVQGPKAREILAPLAPGAATLPYFGLLQTTLGGVPVTVSRTGYTGDLGFEVWVRAEDALRAWDAVWEGSRGRGVVPFGMTALYMARIEAGLLLLGVDFESSRYAFTDAHRSTPAELGLGWTVRDAPTTDRAFLGRDAIRRELRDGTSRWRTVGLVVDWRAWDRVHDEAGLIPPKDHTPIHDEYYLYDDAGAQVGYATSQLYSPMLQRHVGIARVLPALARSGSPVRLEVPVSHRYVYVEAETARLPLFNPERRTA